MLLENCSCFFTKPLVNYSSIYTDLGTIRHDNFSAGYTTSDCAARSVPVSGPANYDIEIWYFHTIFHGGVIHFLRLVMGSLQNSNSNYVHTYRHQRIFTSFIIDIYLVLDLLASVVNSCNWWKFALFSFVVLQHKKLAITTSTLVLSRLLHFDSYN